MQIMIIYTPQISYIHKYRIYEYNTLYDTFPILHKHISGTNYAGDNPFSVFTCILACTAFPKLYVYATSNPA